MKLLSIFLLSASVFAKESNLRRGLEIFETSQCISLDTEPDAYVKAYLSNSGQTMDELVADCGAGGGCEGEETCCRFHTNAIECDSDNDFNHQPCLCNSFTSNLPTPPPTLAPTAAPFEDRIPGPTAQSDNCQIYNPASISYIGYPNPFSVTPYQTCFVDSDCPVTTGMCCSIGFCFCTTVTDRSDCVG